MFSCCSPAELIVIGDDGGNAHEWDPPKGWGRERTYVDIAAAQAKVGDMAEAKKTASLIKMNVGLIGDAYLKIAKEQVKRGNLADAMDSIANMAAADTTVTNMAIANGGERDMNWVRFIQAIEEIKRSYETSFFGD